MTTINRQFLLALAALFALGAVSGMSLAAGEFDGVWKVSDSDGKPFEITLGADGTASASRSGEGMTGTWKTEGQSAVITWNTGWTTKITKDGDAFRKTAYKKGQSFDDKPANSSDAEKVK